MRRWWQAGAVAVLLGGVLVAAPSTVRADDEHMMGAPPMAPMPPRRAARSVRLVVHDGGPVTSAVAAAGCPARSVGRVFALDGAGTFVGFDPAPDFPSVNADWLVLFVGGVPAGTPLVVVCD